MKNFLKIFLGAFTGFFLPYLFVGAIHMMGSANYQSIITSNTFLASVICTTVFGLLISAEKN